MSSNSNLSEAHTTLRTVKVEFENRTMSVNSRLFHHGQAQLYIDLENATQARVSNLLILAGLQTVDSAAAASAAATLLNVRTGAAPSAQQV